MRDLVPRLILPIRYSSSDDMSLLSQKPMPQQSFLDSMPPKQSFYFGLISGIGGMAIAGLLFTMTGGFASGGSPLAKATAPSAPSPTAAALAPSPTPTAADMPPVTDADWVRGDVNKAQVVLVEYSDYECPFCQRHHPTMQKIMQDYGDKVAWVYRHFPLTSIHPQANPAALAAECVGEQKGNDGFWKFTDAMFDNQDQLGDTFYEQTAKSLGVNVDTYTSCYTSKKYAQKVSEQYNGGGAAGVSGTPATFVNGQLVSGAVPYEQFRSIIDSILN